MYPVPYPPLAVPHPCRRDAYFQSWDFVSPHTLKIEMGIANAIAGYNENFKVRQLLGDNMAGSQVKKGMNLDGQRKR